MPISQSLIFYVLVSKKTWRYFHSKKKNIVSAWSIAWAKKSTSVSKLPTIDWFYLQRVICLLARDKLDI